MKVTKTVLEKTIWLGRGTATVMGLAMLLALTIGSATTALAAVPGDPFRLGQVNAVNTLTRLAGNTNNAMLRINNGSAGTNATALDLQVAPGKPPMTVNSAVEVQGLNVDSLDSRNSNDFLEEATDRDDFLPRRIYTVVDGRQGGGGGAVATRSAICDPGDLALSGGGGSLSDQDEVMVLSHKFESATAQGWLVQMRDEFGSSFIQGEVHCADFPPLR